MAEERSSSLDILGVKPVGESVKAVVDGGLSGAGAFLSRICLPAAEEFGLLLRDKVSAWRAANLVRITEKAQLKLNVGPKAESLSSPPRLVFKAIEDGSWVADDEVQEMWAGLLATSCTVEGNDDSNLLFMNLLSQLSVPQARLLRYACETARKYVTEAGWIMADRLRVELETVRKAAGIDDFQRLDRELDHLRALELLIAGGFEPESTAANLTPSALALHLYVRCQGFRSSPVEFFDPPRWEDRYKRQSGPETPTSGVT